jgi:hypothetical protein
MVILYRCGNHYWAIINGEYRFFTVMLKVNHTRMSCAQTCDCLILPTYLKVRVALKDLSTLRVHDLCERERRRTEVRILNGGVIKWRTSTWLPVGMTLTRSPELAIEILAMASSDWG